jgi:hypothetical protein
MLGFYQVTERLYDLFKEKGFNTITLDDEQDIDLKRQSIYPLAHIVPTTSSFNEKTNTFSFLLIVLDVTDFSKKNRNDQNLAFYGIDNRQDILHELFEKLRWVCEEFARGDSYSDKMQLTFPTSAEPIIEDLENVLTGWSILVNIEVPKNPSIC